MNRENDCLLNENTLSQSLALVSLSWPPNLKWNTSIHKDFRNFTDEQPETCEKRQESSSALLHLRSLLFNWVSNLSVSQPASLCFLSGGSFDSKIENYTQCIYLALWFNKRQKEWHRGNTVNLREENNVILLDSLPNANTIYSAGEWHAS